MKIDDLTQICVLRVYKTQDDDKVKTCKKWFYLSDVISYEDGEPESFDWDGPMTYIATQHEAFHISGSADDFHKEMVKFIKGAREEMDTRIEQKINDALDNLGVKEE